jgi:hypothetical protein
MRPFPVCLSLVVVLFWPPPPAASQPLGTFTWQLQPFCNRVTVSVRQDGAVYTLDGTDDQCGAAEKAPLVGLAALNPDGSIGFGLNIVAPTGQPVPVQARISVATLSGTWRDGAGNVGTFVFGGNTGGAPRPLPGEAGDITEVTASTGLTGGGTTGDVTLGVDPAVVQTRVTTACEAGQALRSINQNGTAVCEPVAGGPGDITAVHTGAGLAGGSTTGEVTLTAVFGGDGELNEAARADHEHNGASPTSVGVGRGALGNAAIGSLQNTAVGFGALGELRSGSRNTAVGALALNTSSFPRDNNTAVGASAGSAVSSGSNNTLIGASAGDGVSSGSNNTLVGANADVGSGFFEHATAIGASARVDRSNAVVLGSVAGVNGATATATVGIGTTSPVAPLDVVHDGGGPRPGLRLRRFSSIADDPADVELLRARGTAASGQGQGVLAGDVLGRVSFGGAIVSGNFFDGAAIEASAVEDWTLGSRAARLDFVMGVGSSRINAMSINDDGEVGIGTLDPQDRLQVSGNVRVGIGTTGCVRDADGTVLTGVCSSDARLKRDITPFPASLDRLAALRPVHFYWRAETFPERGFGRRESYGLVAQEVEAVFPALVTTDADGYKAVNYSQLPLLAIQAIKELKASRDELAVRHAHLEAAHAALEQRLAALEALLTRARD